MLPALNLNPHLKRARSTNFQTIPNAYVKNTKCLIMLHSQIDQELLESIIKKNKSTYFLLFCLDDQGLELAEKIINLGLVQIFDATKINKESFEFTHALCCCLGSVDCLASFNYKDNFSSIIFAYIEHALACISGKQQIIFQDFETTLTSLVEYTNKRNYFYQSIQKHLYQSPTILFQNLQTQSCLFESLPIKKEKTPDKNYDDQVKKFQGPYIADKITRFIASCMVK